MTSPKPAAPIPSSVVLKEPKVLYIKTNGFALELDASEGRTFTLKDMQGFVGGYIEVVRFPDGREMVLNEDGRDRLPVNAAASKIWREAFPKDKYPNNNPDTIHGHVLLLENYQWPQEEE